MEFDKIRVDCMSREQLRKMQMIELSMVKEVLKIINKHNLRYFMLGGTLLGAVRHKGFIPWDDDVDLGMPRSDYDKFIEYAKKELPDYLKAETYEDQKNEKRPIYYCQIKNLNTKITQHIAKKDYETNVWIDIFPLDGMPDNPFVRKFHSYHLLYERMRMQYSMFDENVHLHRKNRPFHEKALIAFYNVTKFGSGSDPFFRMEKLDKSMRKYGYDDTHYLINFMGTWKLKEMFPKSVYQEGKLYPFEDIELMGPVDADYVLRQMYGDYMNPIKNTEDQYDHHSIEIKQL